MNNHILKLETKQCPLANFSSLLQGKNASQIVAVTINPEKGGYQAKIYATPDFKMKEIAQSEIDVQKSAIKLRGYFAFGSVKIFTGSREITDLLHDQDTLDQLAESFESVKDAKTGKPIDTLIMLGETQAAVVKYGTAAWKRLDLEGYLPFGIDPSTETVYAFGVERDQKRDIYAGAWNEKMRTMSWKPVIKMAGPIREAGRLVRSFDGTNIVDIAFTDGTTRILRIGIDGMAAWSEATMERTMLAPLFDREGANDVFGLVAYAKNENSVEFIPTHKFTQREKEYVRATTRA